MEPFYFDTVDSFGEWLRHKRESNDLSQDALADRTGLSKSAISLYERDGAIPRLKNLDLLAKGLGVGADEVRSAFSARQVVSNPKYGDVDQYEVMNGVTITFDRKKSKLDQSQRDELVKIIKVVASGLSKK